MSEKRFTAGPIEARAEAGGMTIVGYASVFNAQYDLPGFREQVAPGAFRKSIKESDVAALWNHDPNVVLGRKRSGSLRLEEDAHGLRYEVDLNPADPEAMAVFARIQRGDVYQSSFAFEVPTGKDKWDRADDGTPLRTIKEARLYDVSPVTYPASPTTEVDIKRAIRSLAEALDLDPQDADTVPALWARAQERTATTEEVSPEPVIDHSDPPPPEPEQPHATYIIPGI